MEQSGGMIMIKLFVLITFMMLITACGSGEELDYITIKGEAEAGDRLSVTLEESEDAVNMAFASVVSPKETSAKYQLLVDYMEEAFDKPVNVIRKQTYDEVNELLKNGDVDIGFICSLSYVLGREAGYLEGVATPVVDGEDRYKSYLIVNRNSDIEDIDDLEGKRFAYMDPYSYSGRLAMLNMLDERGYDPDSFFKKTFYTYSHDYSVSAVAKGAVDGATVDSILYDLLKQNNHPDADKIRIIEEGIPAGAPPVVVSSQIDPDLKAQFTDALLSLHESSEGQVILDSIQIDAYTRLEPSHYDPIQEIVDRIGDFQ